MALALLDLFDVYLNVWFVTVKLGNVSLNNLRIIDPYNARQRICDGFEVVVDIAFDDWSHNTCRFVLFEPFTAGLLYWSVDCHSADQRP
jgi:hypothetical protein